MSDEDIRPPTPPVNPPPATSRTAPSRPWAWLPWIIAAGFALVAGWFLQAYLVTREELVLTRSQAALREVEGKFLQQQIEAERILAARGMADLREELPARNDSAQPQVIPLASQPAAAPPSAAVVVWYSSRQEGELVLAGISEPPPGQAYQLWIADAEHPVALSAAVFSVSSMSHGFRVPFKLSQPRADAASFTISVEPKGGAASRQGPVLWSSR